MLASKVPRQPPVLNHAGISIPRVSVSTSNVRIPTFVAPVVKDIQLVTAPSATPQGFRGGGGSSVNTPIDVSRLSELLFSHPDRSFVNFLINGFAHGFDLGYRGPITDGCQRNLLSARSHHAEVSAALAKEVA